MTLDPGAAGIAGDVAAATIGIIMTGCMAVAVLLVLSICKLLEKLGILKPVEPDRWQEDGKEASQLTVQIPPDSLAESPSPVRALVTTGAGLPASRLSKMNPAGSVPGENGHWVRPPEPGGKRSPWSGTLVASGYLVDTEQLAVLYAVIPRGWLN